jgi:anti-sigma B factor antagonist
MNIGIEATTDERGHALLRVSGAIDVQSREALLTAGRAAFESDSPGLVLDLADVTFLDSTGIGALVELGHDAEDADAGFALRDPSPRVVRILAMTGLDDAWPIEETDDTSAN